MSDPEDEATAHADLVERQAEKVLSLLSGGSLSLAELARRTGASEDLVQEAVTHRSGRLKAVNTPYNKVAYDLAGDQRTFEVEQEGDIGGWHAVRSPTTWFRAIALFERCVVSGRPTRIAEVTADGEMIRIVGGDEISEGSPKRIDRI